MRISFSKPKLDPSTADGDFFAYTNEGIVDIESEYHEAVKPKLEDTPTIKEWDYEEILNVLGFGKAQWLLLFLSGLLTITSMASQISVGIIAISSQCEFNMSGLEKSVMMAMCVLGIGISTFVWGYISDAWGRRNVLVWTMFATCILQFFSMFVTNIWLYNSISLIMGISLGGTSGALYPYLGELNSSKFRTIVINYSTTFVAITQIYVPAISWLALSFNWSWDISDAYSFKPWRLIILFNFAPGLIGTLMLLPFPESPKLLLAHGKPKEALKAINWIAKFNTGNNIETLLKTPTICLKPEEFMEAKLNTSGRSCTMFCDLYKAIKPLFYRPHGKHVVIAVVVMFGLFFSNSGLEIWYPEIVNRSSGDNAISSATVCEQIKDSFHKENSTTTEDLFCDDTISTKTYIDNIIVGVVALVGFSIQGLLLNPFGRKNVLLLLCAVGTLSGFLLYAVTDITGILVLFCLYIVLPGLAISIMCGAIVDLVPTNLRGKAVSLALTFGRIGVVVATNVIAAMLEPYCKGAFGIVTSALLLCGVLVYFLPL